mgnify:CR=1 FL=1
MHDFDIVLKQGSFSPRHRPPQMVGTSPRAAEQTSTVDDEESRKNPDLKTSRTTSEHDSAERVRVMYERAFARNPTDEELQATLEYATRLFAEHVNAADESTRQQLVWRDVAHALFCLKEFIYVR